METLKKHRAIVLLFLILTLIELAHIKILFGDAELLAGGDNYTFLQFYKGEIKPYIWDSSYIPLGGVAFYLPYIFSVPLYSKILSFVSYGTAQRVLLFVFFMLRHIALVKLLKYMSKKFSALAMLPILVFYSFNVFESLNPFSLFSLMYSIYLPFILYYYIKLFNSERFDLVIISKLILLSIIFAPLNANVALSITLFLPLFIYTFLNIPKLNKIKLINLVVYGFLFVLANIWWIFSLAVYYIQSAGAVLNSGWFSATGAGNLSQNFRFIGQWGWYGSHYLKAYYPFNNYYDTPLILIATFIPIIFAFYEGFRKDADSSIQNYKYFLILIGLLALFFVNGTRPPFGLIYQFFYDHLFILRIFREPFTKFTEIYVLSIVSLCYLFLLHLSTKLNLKKYLFACFIALSIVVLNTKPVLIGDHVVASWNGSVRTMQVDIPYYWKEFEEYTTKTLSNARILTLPKVYYGAAWNWIRGFTSADDVAVNFVHNGNGIIRGLLNNGSISSGLINNIFGKNKLSKNYLALLGINYILQENDMDWRYSGDGTLSPELTTKFINTLNIFPVKSFGTFDKVYMSNIPNKEPNNGLKNQLTYELLNKNILNLFYIDQKDTLPLFYIPQYTVYSVNDPSGLQKTLNVGNYDIKTQYYLKNKKRFNKELIRISDEITVIGNKLEPKINFATLVWNPSWSWPLPSVSPNNTKYTLVLIKEKLSLLTQTSILGKVDTYIWLGAKRISEINKYELRGNPALENIKKATELFKTAASLIEPDFPENSQFEYWEMQGKLYSYLQKSISVLQKNEFNEIELEEITKLFDDHAKNLQERVRTGCSYYCYTFEIPQDGSYTLFNANASLDNAIAIKENVNLISGDIYKLDYQEPSPRYILELDRITKNNVAQFIKLLEWVPNSTYKITFDYKVKDSDFDLIVLEDKADYATTKLGATVVTQRKKLFNQNFNQSRICLDNSECYSHYERYIEASPDAKGGYLYITLPAEDAPNSHADIINIKIEAFSEPLLFLKLANTSKPVQMPPNIAFKKINPTKYEIYVSNAITPYTLVFNESFSRFWKLRLVDESHEDRYYNTDFFSRSLNQLVSKNEFFSNLSYRSIFSKEVSRDSHYTVNSYANSWYITPSNVQKNENYTLIAEFSLQKYLVGFFMLFGFAFFVSSFIVFVHLFARLFSARRLRDLSRR